MNLRRMIYLFSTVWLLVTLLIVNLAIYFLFHKITINDELDRMRSQTDNISAALNPENNVAPDDFLQAYLPPDGMIRVIDQDSNPVLSTTKNTDITSLTPHFKNAQSSDVRKLNGTTYGVIMMPIIWDDGRIVTLEVTESLEDLQDNMNILKIILVVASFVIIIPSILGGRLLGNFFLRPIRAMTETMKDIQESGEFKKISLEQTKQDELNQMADTFNQMIDILKTNYDKQQAFVSDASHELKTPLTVIESNANMLKRWGMNDPEVLEDSVDAIYSESVRMRDMTQQMLALANNEEDLNLAIADVDLVQVCRDAVQTMAHVYEREMSVHAHQDQIWIKADESKLKQVLFILLDNALKYSSDALDVWTGVEEANAFMTVEDHGAGIPEDDQPHVFERFYRVDKARSRKTGSTGLGLAIAKQIVDAHNGTLSLSSQEGQGTRVTVFMGPVIKTDEEEP